MPQLFAVFFIVAIDVFGMTLVLPLLPFYAESFGATAQTATLLVSVFALGQFVAAPVLGRWADRIGHRPVLLLSQMGTCAGFLLLAYAPSLAWVFAARALDGITSGNLSVVQAYLARVTQPKDRASAFGKLSLAFGAGFLIGPLASAALFKFGYKAPFFAAAMLSAMSIAATYRFLPALSPIAPEQAHASGAESRPTFREGWNHRPLRTLLVQFFLFCFAFNVLASGFALFAERRYTAGGDVFGAREVGYLLAYCGLLAVILQGFLIKRLTARFGESALSRVGFILVSLGTAWLAQSTHLTTLIAASTLIYTGAGLLRPTLLSALSQVARIGTEGMVIGLAQSLNSLAQILAPLLAGALIAQGRLALWSYSATVVTVLGLLLSVGALLRSNKDRAH